MSAQGQRGMGKAAIAVRVALLALIAAVAFAFTGCQSMAGDVDAAEGSSGSVSEGSRADQSDPFEGVTEEDHPVVQRANPEDVAPGRVTPAFTQPAGGSDTGEQLDAPHLEGVDGEALRDTACDLMKALFDYTSETIDSPFYADKLLAYLAGDYNADGLLGRYTDPAWRSSAATYPALLSAVVDINVEAPYISHIGSHDGMRAVNVSIAIECNQGDPGEYAWETVNIYKRSYGVFFDDDNKVVDVMYQYGEIVESNVLGYEAPITQDIREEGCGE